MSDTPEQARASAHASIARAGAAPFIGPRRQWPSDVPDAAHGPRGEVESRPALNALARPEPAAPPLSAWDEQVPPTGCDPTPRPPSCGVTSAPVPRDPPGMSHRVPPSPVDDLVSVLHADLFSDLARCRIAVDQMRHRVVTRERMPPRPVVAPPLPVIPELVDGADAAARRNVIDRVKPLLAELTGILATAPADVAARARAVVAKAMTLPR